MESDMNVELIEPVVFCVNDIKVKDEDPLSMLHAEGGPSLENIIKIDLTETVKKESGRPTVVMPLQRVYQHNTQVVRNAPVLYLNPVQTVSPNVTTLTITPVNTDYNIPNRNVKTNNKKSPQDVILNKYKHKLMQYQKHLEKKKKQVRQLQTQLRRQKTNNEKFKQLLKKLKQKQVISEAVLKDIAKNSKIANTIIAHMMSN